MGYRSFLTKLAAIAAAGVTVATLTGGAAMADPTSTPRAQDIVGVGSDTIQYLFDQFSHDFNKGLATSAAHLYSYDATGTANITPKSGCSSITRPDGSGAGISALEGGQGISGGTKECIDFARSSRGRTSTDPLCTTSGGICFVNLAGDAVTWAARSASAGGTDAPTTLSLTQLKNIYTCKTRNWANVGGKSATIKPFLPQSASGTRSFFLTALGGGTTPITPGSCVSDGATSQFPGGTIQENEGQDAMLNDAAAIFPYSVADYLAQAYHEATCTSGCGGTVSDNPVCAAKAPENLFGCNETGGTAPAGQAVKAVLSLMKIQGTSPTTPATLPGEPVPPKVNNTPKVNKAFDKSFQRVVYEVVRADTTTSDHIPAYLEPFFSSSGWTCSNATAIKDVKDYGFLVLPTCGAAS